MSYNRPYSHTTYGGEGRFADGYGVGSDHRTSTHHIQYGNRLKTDYLGLQPKDLSPFNSRSTSPLFSPDSDNQRKSKVSTGLTEFDKNQSKTPLSPQTSAENVMQLIKYAKKFRSLNIDEIEKEIDELKTASRTEQRYRDENDISELKELKEKCMALQAKHDSFQKKYEQAVEDKDEYEEKFKKLLEEFKAKEKETKYLEMVVTEKETELRSLRSEKDQELKQLRTDKESALSRLSKEMGDKLNKDNTAIADLSDPRRSTKVAELYNSIYDNEWTDALETLQAGGLEEEHAIRALLEIMKNIYEFCWKLKDEHLEQLARHVLNPFSQRQAWVEETMPSGQVQNQIRSMLMDCIKIGAKDMVLTLKKNYLAIKQKPLYAERVPEYVEKTMELCWLMHMCSPPLVYGHQPLSGEPLDKNLYKEYTKQGDLVSFVVWFPLLIEKDGAVLTKGVAQPIHSVTKASRSIGKGKPNKDDSYKYQTDRQPVHEKKDTKEDQLSDFFQSKGSRVYTGRYNDTGQGTKHFLYGKNYDREESELNAKSHGEDFGKRSTTKAHTSYTSEFMSKHHDKGQNQQQTYRPYDGDDEVTKRRNREKTSESSSDRKYMNNEYGDKQLQHRSGKSDNRSGHILPMWTIEGVDYGYYNDKMVIRTTPNGKWRYVETGYSGSTNA